MLNKERNFEIRLEFVRFWESYVRSNSDKVWSRQHAEFVNSLLKTANQNGKLYNRVKKIVAGS